MKERDLWYIILMTELNGRMVLPADSIETIVKQNSFNQLYFSLIVLQSMVGNWTVNGTILQLRVGD